MSTSRVTLAAAFVAGVLALTLGIAAPASAASSYAPTNNIPCAKLASAVSPKTAFAFPVPIRDGAVSEMLATTISAGHIIPSAEYIRANGGLVCEWSNGLPYTGYSVPVSWQGVRVEYTQNVRADYERWDAPGPTAPEHWSCFVPGWCDYQGVRGDDWLSISIVGARSDAAARTLAFKIRDALLLGSERLYTPPASAHPLGPLCSDLISETAFKNAIGSTVGVVYRADPPSWSQWHAAIHRIPAPQCAVGDASGLGFVGLFQAIPGGRWAFDELRSSMALPGPLTSFTPAGWRAGDAAWTRCNPGRTYCILDLIVADHWIQVELVPADPGEPVMVRFDRMAAMTNLAREIVSSVYA